MTFDEIIVMAGIVAIFSGVAYYFSMQKSQKRSAQKEFNNLIAKNIDNSIPLIKKCAERFDEIKSQRTVKKENA